MDELRAEPTLELFIKRCKENNVERILDIGSGSGGHARRISNAGLHVETNDILPSDHQMPYQELIDLRGFSGIWCSHVLEHQINPGSFLRQIHNDLHKGGVLAITVPPRKDLIVGGHVTLWNAGILLYNLILAGFDCSKASVATYGYNVSVVLNKISIDIPHDLHHDKGDLAKLQHFFPDKLKVFQNFNGNIRHINWPDHNMLEEPCFNHHLINQ